VLIVCTPEPTAITDSYAMAKVLVREGYSGQMSLLVNLAFDRHDARVTFQRIAGVARQFLGTTIYDAGYILIDSKVRDAVRRREPFVLAYPRCSASLCLAALATKLIAGGALAGKKESFFSRMANWFA
jgi:flagellar biosynthesis protein FlhG